MKMRVKGIAGNDATSAGRGSRGGDHDVIAQRGRALKKCAFRALRAPAAVLQARHHCGPGAERAFTPIGPNC
jgi:hypothetical protein